MATMIDVLHWSLVLVCVPLVAPQSASDYYCEDFFQDITLRSPLWFKIDDNAVTGTVLKSFTRHPNSRNRVTFTYGDLAFVDFSPADHALITKSYLYAKADQTLQINGNCTMFIERINHLVTLPIKIFIQVVDTNDVPVFANLPAFLRIQESVRVGSLLYNVEMKKGLDTRKEFASEVLQMKEVVVEGYPDRDPKSYFSLDLNGNVYLRQPIDFETDPRKFNITIYAEDLGEPPLSSKSTLVFYVQDVDDMLPKFSHHQYSARIVGEKPVSSARCQETEPPIFAEDQDTRAKSVVHYTIVDGSPGTNSEWGRLFKLDETSGHLCQLSTVDRTVPDPLTGRVGFGNYTFKIKAYQTDNLRKYATAQLHVYVTDLNEHAPSFKRRLYRASVPEYPQVKEGDRIIEVKAIDKDHGLNSEFQYSIEGDAAGTFGIDPVTGWITAKDPRRLDREIYNYIEFKVKAKETGTVEKRQDKARVIVNIDDLNDNAPEFAQYQYRFTIKDNLRPNTIIHSLGEGVRATDKDSGDNGRILYRVPDIWRTGGETLLSDFGRFSIDMEDGTLRLSTTLEDLRRRHDHPEYRLEVTATDMAPKKADRKSSAVSVFIRVIEANDHVPIITPKRGPVVINEAAPLGTVLHHIQVKDADGDEDVYLKYSIIEGNGGNKFKISMGGRVMLNKPLDREKTEFYKLRIEISDGKHRKLTTVKVQVEDSNDNSPRFTQEEYVFRLDEEPGQDREVGLVSAADPDAGLAGTVTYTIKGVPGADIFNVDMKGRVSVRKSNTLLDREVNDKVTFKVVASDMGEPQLQSTADVTLLVDDVNDNPPSFTVPVYHGWVEEDNADPTPQFVTLDIPINATDADAEFVNRNIRYSLSGTGSELFSMDPIRADVITSSVGQMDSENRQEYKLQITAQDHGGTGMTSTAQLVIKVRDKNDNAPHFEGPRSFTIKSDTPKGQKVASVFARDRDVTKPNQDVIYLLQEGGNGKFAVNYATGDISVVDDLKRDPVIPEYHLRVQALDGGSPRLVNHTTVSIRVPINRAPVIDKSSTKLQIKEDAPLGSVVGALRAADGDTDAGDQRPFEFFIRDNGVPFQVSPQGVITTKAYLDRERTDTYEFDLYVKDEGKPPMTSSARITVVVDDVNDHAPQFGHARYEGFIVEDDTDPVDRQPVKMNVNISAIDKDVTVSRDDIMFSLHGPGSEFFTIRSRTGEVSVSQFGYGLIDRESTEQYRLRVRATDQRGLGLSNETDLIVHVIDVNDRTPQFHKGTGYFSVSSVVEVGQVIGVLHADDKDATAPNNKVIYTLENDPYGKFAVDTYTGEVRVLTGVFYPPRQGSYMLKVAATDLGYPPRRSEIEAEIRVDKSDFNDYKPEFHGETIFYINEQVPIGTLVGTVDVNDPDLGHGNDVSLTIQSSTVPAPFVIDSRTGEIRTSAILDFDTGVRAYTFIVVAKDTGDPQKTGQTSVGVILEDINDNPPRFTQEKYHHMVSNMFPAGTEVATPFAYDDVDSANSVYLYSLEGVDAGLYFYIDERSGIVRTTEEFAQISAKRVNFTIHAQDMYNSRLAAKSKLRIDIYHQGGTKCCCKVPCDSSRTP